MIEENFSDLSNSNVNESKNKDIQENKAITVLSYIWILFLIPLLVKKESKFCIGYIHFGKSEIIY